MHLGVLGINSSSCPLEIREKATLAFQKRFSLEVCMKTSFPFVLLLTCQRVELYFFSNEVKQITRQVICELEEEIEGLKSSFFYFFFDELVWEHLAKVTTGLESIVIGETEIQGQVKRAYHLYKENNILSGALHALFQKTLALAKNYRSKQVYPKNAPSFESVIIRKIKEEFGSNTFLKVLFIGYSKMNQSLLLSFHRKGYVNLHLATQTPKEEMVRGIGNLKVFTRTVLQKPLDFDVIISATKDLDGCIKKEMLEEGKKIIFDLSIPRTIDTGCKSKEGCHLYNLEELSEIYKQQVSMPCWLHKEHKEQIQKKSFEAYRRYEAKSKKKAGKELHCQPCSV